MNQNIEITLLESLNQDELKNIEILLTQLNPDFTPPASQQAIIAVIKHPSTSIFVARDENTIIGMVTLCTYPQIEEQKMSWIEDFVVDTPYRQKGIGTNLITHAHKHAKALGFRYSNLTSRPSRTIANAYYKKIGYNLRETNVYRLEL